MRILQIITLSEIGGAQRIVHDLAARLDRSRFQVTVACGPGGELVNWLRQAEIEVQELPELRRSVGPLGDWRALVAIYRLIRGGRYDIVHCHSTKAGVLGRLAAWLAGVRRVYFTAHGWSISDQDAWWSRTAYRLVERFMSHFTSTLICVSQHDVAMARRWGLNRATRMELIPNGVEPAALHPDRPSHHPAPRTIAFVGRLAFPKEPTRFVEAAAAYRKDYGEILPVRFVVVGDGPLLPDVQRVVTQHELEQFVQVLGKRDDAASIMQTMDAVVLLSQREGLPLVVLEAMSAARPVVASAVGGIPEVIRDGVNGLLIPPGMPPEEIARRLFELVRDPARLEEIGQRARQDMEARYTTVRMVEAYESLYLSGMGD